MKTLKTLLSVFALAAVFSSSALAQQTISSTATILDALTFGTHSDLAFGEIIAGNSASIAADSSSAGYFEITGYDDSKDVEVSVAKSNETFGGGGSATLTLAALNFGFSASASPSTSTTVSGGTVDLAGQTDNLYLYVGGTLDASSATSGGAYSSTVTLTIDYVN